MPDKILKESTNNIDIAVAWVINTKNSLTIVHGFLLYQLAIGQNPMQLVKTPFCPVLPQANH